MPKPIICLPDTLRQFVEVFRGCFSQRHLWFPSCVVCGSSFSPSLFQGLRDGVVDSARLQAVLLQQLVG